MTEYHDIRHGVSAQTFTAMRAAGCLTRNAEAGDELTVHVDNLRVCINLHAALPLFRFSISAISSGFFPS